MKPEHIHRRNPNVNHRRWVLMVYNCRLITCNARTSLCMGLILQWLYAGYKGGIWELCAFLLSIAMTIKLL